MNIPRGNPQIKARLNCHANHKMSENSSRHISYEQAKAVVDFMGQHVEFATGSLRTLEARHTNKRLWNEITNILNNTRTGTRKTADGWSKYWSDYKNKLKKKVIMINRMKLSGIANDTKPLTKLERRALVILGPNFTKNKYSPDNKRSFSNHLPPEVKLEGYNDILDNDCSNNGSEISERLTDVERDESDEAIEGSGESDDDVNGTGIQSIYPKWLIEVEKKRADAELTRAKAEEKRANIAAQNAEAAMIQAEALKKLADAAVTQADAVSRIAVALESRAQPLVEDVLAI